MLVIFGFQQLLDELRLVRMVSENHGYRRLKVMLVLDQHSLIVATFFYDLTEELNLVLIDGRLRV